MEIVSYNNYNFDGKIIDVQDEVSFNEEHLPGSINIPYDKLMFNYKKYLNKMEKYYIYCKKGRKSKKAVEILKYYGYDVKQITK